MTDYSIPTLHESTPNYPLPKTVYDLDMLKSECVVLSIIPSRPNIRRIRRAFDLVDNHRIRKIDTAGHVRIYEVGSQTRDLVHLVVANGDNRCTCEDARNHNFTGCKHAIAVQIYEERMDDYESYFQWIEERRSIDPTRCRVNTTGSIRKELNDG